jgi:hypothetical protein
MVQRLRPGRDLSQPKKSTEKQAGTTVDNTADAAPIDAAKNGGLPPAGTLSEGAPVGASLRKVAKNPNSKDPKNTASYFRADVERELVRPLVLSDEHVQAKLNTWYQGHDVFHVISHGFGSVADEILPALHTGVARGLVRCIWNGAGTIDFDHAKGMSSDDAEAAVAKVLTHIEALHAEAPDNSVYLLLSKPEWVQRLSNPHALLSSTLLAAFLEIPRSTESFSRLDWKEKARVSKLCTEMELAEIYGRGLTIEEVSEGLKEWSTHGRPPEFVAEIVRLMNQAGWSIDFDPLLAQAKAATDSLKHVIEHPSAQTIDGVWLLPADPADPHRTEPLERVLAHIQSFDSALKESDSIEWVQLPSTK